MTNTTTTRITKAQRQAARAAAEKVGTEPTATVECLRAYDDNTASFEAGKYYGAHALVTGETIIWDAAGETIRCNNLTGFRFVNGETEQEARAALYETSIDIAQAIQWLTGSMPEDASTRIAKAMHFLSLHQDRRAAVNRQTDAMQKGGK